MKLDEAIKLLHEHGYMLNELNTNVFYPSLDAEYRSKLSADGLPYPSDQVYRDPVKLVSDISKQISNGDTITVIRPPLAPKYVTDEVIYRAFDAYKKAKYVLIADINTSEFRKLAKEHGLNSDWFTTHGQYILYELSKAEETPAEPETPIDPEPEPKRGFFSRFRSH